MKKQYFMIAAAATLFAACAETDLIDEVSVQEVPQVIGFETFVDKATRVGEESNTTALNLHHQSFKVWGYKMVPAIVTAFDGVTITYNSNSTNNTTKWEYSPLRYWDKTATSYEFYAATPKDENWEIVTTSTIEGTTPTTTDLTANNYYLTLDGFTLEDHDATNQNSRGNEVSYFNDSQINKDLMVATSSTKNALVDFTFNHILSRLDVTVAKEVNFTETITVKEFQVCNLFGKGNYTQKATPTWETIDNSYITYNTGAVCEVSVDEKYLLQSLIIPQTATYASIDTDGSNKGDYPYIWIQYTIQDETVANSTPETFNAYYNLADVFGDAALAITAGYRYTLGITISPNAIEFDGDVTNWVSQSATDIEIQ